jgi:nickel-dependent lactate racemase
MTILAEKSGLELALNRAEKKEILEQAIAKSGNDFKKVLIIPPDFTRFNSNAGELTAIIYEILSQQAEIDILPALGTHVAMSEHEITTMFGNDIPLDRFIVHDWRNGLIHLGDVPGEMLKEWSGGKVDYSVKIEVNKILFNGYDLILSVGQVVPHEVVGMANYTKNICVGIGGEDTINKSHFLGAVYGMEQMMGRIDTPVRKLLNYGVDNFMAELPLCFILSVMQKNQDSGKMEMRGLFAGNGMDLFTKAAKLSQQTNLDQLDKPLKKVVVYLDPEEFKSTWLGNKSVYRTRMVMADDGELIVLAPGLKEFGEDPEIDRLIRKYGYKGTPTTLASVQENDDLRNNLSAAAHLIHGSSEGRFNITYCPGPGISHEEIASVGFTPSNLDEMMAKYNPETMKDGFNTVDGEEIFFISNPGLGLWALKSQFE